MISRIAHMGLASLISGVIGLAPISVMAADPAPGSSPATAPAAAPTAPPAEKSAEKKAKKKASKEG